MIEIVLGTLPPNQPFAVEGDDQREALEAELRRLWATRQQLSS
jgi:hypothetical protein